MGDAIATVFWVVLALTILGVASAGRWREEAQAWLDQTVNPEPPEPEQPFEPVVHFNILRKD